MFTHIAVVRDLVAMQYKEYQEVQQHSTASFEFILQTHCGSLHCVCSPFPAEAAERPEVCDRRVGVHRVRAPAGARPVGAPHRLPPGQVCAGDDGGAVPHEEEDGPQRHVLHPLPVHPGDGDHHQLHAGVQL